MNDDELAELLRLVDEPAEDVPIAFERRLWEELSTTFDARPSADVTMPVSGSNGSEDIEFRPVDDRLAIRARWTRWGTLVAALVAVLAVGVLLVSGDDEPDGAIELTDTADPTAPPTTTAPVATAPVVTVPPAIKSTVASDVGAPEVLLDPVAACQRFRIGVAPLVDLPDALEAFRTSATPVAVDGARTHIESVRTALETYAADLEAGGFIDETQAIEFRNAARTLGQAIAELDSGNVDAAALIVVDAQETVGVLLAELEVPGQRFDPFEPTALTCGE